MIQTIRMTATSWRQKTRNWKMSLLLTRSATNPKSPQNFHRNLIHALLRHSQNLRPNSCRHALRTRREVASVGESFEVEWQMSLDRWLALSRGRRLQRRAADPNPSFPDCRH